MSLVFVSSQCQGAVVAVPNSHPIVSSTCSSAHCTLTDGCGIWKQPFSSGYGLSMGSTLESQFNAFQFERLNEKPNSCSSASSSSSTPSRMSLRWRLRPEAGSRGNGRGVTRAVDGSRCGDSVEFRLGVAGAQPVQRRELVRVISSWIALPGLISAGSACGAAVAEEDEQGPESSTTVAPPAKTLVEKLLERSKANKAKYDQERLDAYYRRNFTDYFGFLKGSIQNKEASKLTEAEKGILSWLEKNQ